MYHTLENNNYNNDYDNKNTNNKRFSRLTQDYEKALAEKNELKRHNHIVSKIKCQNS